MIHRAKTTFLLAAGLLLSMTASAPCRAQSTRPALFVANNGNLEGSVSSFLVNADGTLTFVHKVVTPGSTNAQCIDISPNGRWLVTGHGTASTTTEQLTFFEVHSDATMSLVLEGSTPDSPVGIAWMDDAHFVVTNTSTNPDRVIVYQFNPPPAAPSITQLGFSTLGTGTFDIEIDRAHSLLYPRSSTSTVWPMRINADFSLTKLTAAEVPTGVFFLGPDLSPDGSKLYYSGGISSFGGLSSRWIGGFNIDTATGALTPMPGSPYLSPPFGATAGPSPKQAMVSANGQFLYATHGGTGHMQGFSIDRETGALTAITGATFRVSDLGIDCGNMSAMGNRMYVARRFASLTPVQPAGVVSLTIMPDGMLSLVGTFGTGGSQPNDIAVWPGAGSDCPADVNGSGAVDVDDLVIVILNWGVCPATPECPGDVNNSQAVDVDDLVAVILAWGPCP